MTKFNADVVIGSRFIAPNTRGFPISGTSWEPRSHIVQHSEQHHIHRYLQLLPDVPARTGRSEILKTMGGPICEILSTAVYNSKAFYEVPVSYAAGE